MHQRHPNERGSLLQRLITSQFHFLTSARFMRRHPRPFSKSPRGLARRRTRLWLAKQQQELFQ